MFVLTSIPIFLFLKNVDKLKQVVYICADKCKLQNNKYFYIVSAFDE